MPPAGRSSDVAGASPPEVVKSRHRRPKKLKPTMIPLVDSSSSAAATDVRGSEGGGGRILTGWTAPHPQHPKSKEDNSEGKPAKLKDPFDEAVPLSSDKVKPFDRSGRVDAFRAARYKKFRHELQLENSGQRQSSRFAARAEVLHQEESGYIEANTFDNEQTYQVSQKEIVESVDVTSATKHFDLSLAHGPYSLDYFRSGRQLVLGGRRGHVAALDWVTKDLLCEFNVQESVHAVKWLHVPSMFAVAQKDWVHIYDSRGTELHCLKRLYRVKLMEFLPYHFLLVTASDNNFLTWTDTSVGRIVATARNKKSSTISGLAQNPYNAIIHTAHPNGVVNLWSPNTPSDPLVSILCHGCPIRGLAVDSQGLTMATVATNGELKIWDVRNTYRPVREYTLRNSPSGLAMSQRGLIAVSTGNILHVYKDLVSPDDEMIRRPEPYMRHKVDGGGGGGGGSGGIISSLQFANFEDVIGLGHAGGLSSCIIPGASEANMDTFETNPFGSRSQKREMEVKQLLEKISHELISLDPQSLAAVNRKELEASREAKAARRFLKVPDIEFAQERHPLSVRRKKEQKKTGAGGLAGAKAKAARREDVRREEVKRSIKADRPKQKTNFQQKTTKKKTSDDVAIQAAKDALGRFRKKRN